MTLEAMRAAEKLQEIGVDAAVYDLRVIRPLNLQKIYDSVNQTGHIITIDTGFKKFGIGAEICSEVVTHCFDKLIKAPVRIGMPDHPTPSSRGFLPGLYPDAVRILREAGEMLGVPNEKIALAIERFIADRKGLPVDVPDPFFTGPF
jgi:pyruvate dehydrogenase E1 component beta subunit